MITDSPNDLQRGTQQPENLQGAGQPVGELQLGKWIAGAAVGALVMYMLDPERGARRRAEAGARLREIGRQTGDAVSDVMRDVSHRTGMADVFHASDSVGHGGGMPHDAASGMRPHDAGSGLQPQNLSDILRKSETPMEAVLRGLRERSWDPKVRNAALYGGGALGLFSLFNRRSPLAMPAALAGAALLARGASGPSAPGTAAAGTPGRRVGIEKTIRIDAAPEQVYDLWASYENFPRFMPNVLEVRDLGDRRSHWIVKGPAGRTFAWDSMITDQSRPHRLAWQSAPGSEIEQAGEVRFEPIQGGTRATVRLSYSPPAGAAGRALASLLGSNPERQLEEDLLRMKSLLERGGLPHPVSQGGTADSSFLH